ncbi:hypothetical protein [Roseibium alexandrii]|uniref:hypothetical protein n=1 Tax=Roseibium alexandrii TaxID=388408 RepID=UPI0037536416
MTNKTVKEQIKDADQVVKLINDGNALAKKLAEELRQCRQVLELLRAFQPNDQFKVNLPYWMKSKNSESGSMREILDLQIAEINGILGDRA